MQHRPSVLSALSVVVILLVLVTLCASVGAQEQQPVYKDTKAPVEARVADLLQRLTLDEKLDLLGGTGFTTKPIPRLDLPAMKMSDGPLGVRHGDSTVLPAGPLLGATWDPAVLEGIGTVQGEELQSKDDGMKVILGPCINIHRTPLGGRNGESFSEDPYLTGRLAVGYVNGVQRTGAAACVKHFACNNQEQDRMWVDIHVSERALREIYLPAFRATVQDAHALCIMDAYNQVNGAFCSANGHLLNDILKQEWGFTGLVMSDWGAVHDVLGPTLHGNDLEMPVGYSLNPWNLKPLIAAGTVPMSVIDDKVRRILRTEITVGLLDGPYQRPAGSVVSNAAHLQIVREAAEKGIVLLKNQHNALPIARAQIKRIAVIGELAAHMPGTIGGSGYVTAKVPLVSLLAGLRAAAGPGISVSYAPGGGPNRGYTDLAEALIPPDGKGKGLLGEYFLGKEMQGAPVLTRVDPRLDFNWSSKAPDASMPLTNYSARWTGWVTAPATAVYEFALTSDDGSRLFLDNKLVVDNWGDHGAYTKSVTMNLLAGQRHKITVEYYQATSDASIYLQWNAHSIAAGALDPEMAAAVAAAKQADIAVVCVGLNSDFEGEGHDRSYLALPGNQDALVAAVAAANPRTVVVLFNGGVVIPGDWVNQVPALLEAYYPGNEGGAALASILFGDVNPSGRLPETIAKRREDYADYGYYPQSNIYGEGIYVGYRHFEKAGITPLFPFGHGLSYTTFQYSDLKITPHTLTPDGLVHVTCSVKNIGKRAGAEVVQLYIHDPHPKIDKAPRELKGFTRVQLKPGEKKTVSLSLSPQALAYYDTARTRWVADAGVYDILLGASSQDIRLSGKLTLQGLWSEKVSGSPAQ
jgi:beta-glucosidase